MATATGARSRVAYVTESTWGTTPPTPAMVGLPYVSFGINLGKTVHNDDSVQSDRMLRHSVHGNKTVTGPLTVNYSAADFDGLLESAFNSTISTGVLKTGSTQKSFTIEQGSIDIGQYTVYTGCVVNSVSINVPVSGLVSSTFNIIGKDSTLSGTPLDASITPATASAPFFHGGGVFKEGGSTVATITAINFTIDNTSATNYALGSTAASSITNGMSKITGTVSAYFENATLVNKFINGTASSLEFTLTDGVTSHTYKMGNVKYNGATKTISGQGAVLISLPFEALYNAADASNIVLTIA